MSAIEDEFASALNSPVKRKSNNTRNLRHRATKVSSGVPEVMAKVSGFSRGASHLKAHFTYITRHGKLELENESGQVFKGKEDIGELFSEWAADIGEAARRKNQRDAMHLVLSMPETVDSVSVHQAVREFTRKTFGANYDYVFAMHTDTANPHCHVAVKMRGHDGRYLNPKKADLQAWRDGFSEALQLQGVEAASTARRSRGVVKKAEKSVIRHIERGDDKTPPRVSTVKVLQRQEIAQELIGELKGQAPKSRPWELKIAARQNEVRQAWLRASTVLDQPRPVILFKKAPINEPPEYDRLDFGNVRRAQLSAGLYQSGLKAARRQEPAAAFAGLRNLSSLPLVQSQRTTEMLLHAHARADLGHDGRGPTAAGVGLRRAGDRSVGPGRADGAGDGRRLGAVPPDVLSAQIRGFVAAMPAVETARDVIRRELMEHVRSEKARMQTNTPIQAQAVRPVDNPKPPEPPLRGSERQPDLGQDR